MNDFIKIFTVLGLTVAAFMFGRSYGERTYRESENYRNLVRASEELNHTKSELENTKAKLQNIVDGAETKKQDELLSQILEVFLLDLGLRVQNQQALLKAKESHAPSSAVVLPQKSEEPKQAQVPPKSNDDLELKNKRLESERERNFAKWKSFEWMLANAQDPNSLRKNLKNLEIKNIDQFLKSSTRATPEQTQPFYGSYRGRIMDITNNEYGTLSLQINSIEQNDKTLFEGHVKIFKNGKEQSSKGFTTDQLGYVVNGSSSFIIDNGSQFYQLYKAVGTEHIAGHMYDRGVQGTTKTVGSFVLNRVDKF